MLDAYANVASELGKYRGKTQKEGMRKTSVIQRFSAIHIHTPETHIYKKLWAHKLKCGMLIRLTLDLPSLRHTNRAYKCKIKLNFGVQHGVLLDYLIRF